MGLFARLKAVWYAIFNKSVTEMEDKHVIALADSKLQQATERLKDARKGLVDYRALVYKVQQQVETGKDRIVSLTGQIKGHLNAGREDIAGQLAMELSRVKTELGSNEEQLKLHEQAYENNLLKMKSALKDIEGTKSQLEKKKAALQMEKALAEVSETAGALSSDVDVTTDLGAIMGRVDEQINKAKARSTVAGDLSSQNLDRLKAERDMEHDHAKELLEQFKIEQGMVDAPTAKSSEKTLGPQIEESAEPEAESN